MVAFLVNKIVALGRQIIIAPTFGTGREFDAFVAAFRLPDILYMMISGGALATALIPVLSERLTQRNEFDPTGWRLVSATINTMFVTVMTISAVVALFALPLVETIIAPGFDADTQQLTANLMRLVLLSTIVFSISGLVGAVLNTHQHFLLPALAPILYNLGIIGGAIFLVPLFGIYGLVWGTIIGSVGHLLIQLPGLLHYARHSTEQERRATVYHLTLGWRDSGLHEIIRLMGPRVLTMFIIQLNFVVMFNLASRLGEGSVSALDYGWDLMQMPQTIIGTAIGVVLFPTMSEIAARQDVARLWQTTLQTLQIMLTLAVPATIGLIVLGQPTIQLLFARGQFDADSTRLVYQTLQFWALALIAHCLMEVINRFFYAQKDALTPLCSSTVSMFLNIALAYGLYRPLDAGGLALANGIAVTLEIGLLLLLARRHPDVTPLTPLLDTFGRALVAALVMGGTVWLFIQMAHLPLLLTIGVGGLLGVLVYGLIGVAIGLRELGWLFSLVQTRLNF